MNDLKMTALALDMRSGIHDILKRYGIHDELQRSLCSLEINDLISKVLDEVKKAKVEEMKMGLVKND